MLNKIIAWSPGHRPVVLAVAALVLLLGGLQLAAGLDAAGDAGDLKDTQENQAGWRDALETIREL